jgi:hypothetical protein
MPFVLSESKHDLEALQFEMPFSAPIHKLRTGFDWLRANGTLFQTLTENDE